MPTSKKTAEEIFEAAQKLPSWEAKIAYLDDACAGDPALHERLEELLRPSELPTNFFPRNTDGREEAVFITEKPGDHIGRYKILQKIGEGGCGVVYMAEQEEPVRRRVALKVIKLGMDTKSVIARFEAERQALALMDHPNIAKVLDAGSTETGRPYFVMELVQGIRITDYCDQNNLPTRERLDLFTQICHAIQHAHQKGIIHRDIKPSNILVTLHDGRPAPKVIDFGIAKATSGQRLTDKTLFTALEQFIGTPAYMSPEQAEMSGLDIDTRSDIYALGVLLYELLTGKTPFDAKRLLQAGLDEIRRIIREEEPPPPSTRLSSLALTDLTAIAKHHQAEPAKLTSLMRGELDWIVMKCLEKDRTRRYETSNGVAADVQRHLNNEPVTAGPPTAGYRLRKLLRKHRTVVSVAATFLLLLTAATAASTWQALRATQAERRQNTLRQAVQTERDRAQEAQRLAEEQREHADQQRTNAERNLYLFKMSLVKQAWDRNDWPRVDELLRDTTVYPQRGFEWYYWRRLLSDSLVLFSQRPMQVGKEMPYKGHGSILLKGHSASILSLAFSPDGQQIVTGSYDQTAKVWEAASGNDVLTLKEHSGPIFSVAFSPNGLRIVTGNWDKAATIWEAASGKELLILEGHSNYISSVAFSPDGHWIVTGSYDRTAKVWEVTSGKEKLTLRGHSSSISSVAISPDGQRIVTGSRDKTAKVWEAASGRELLTLKGHGERITSVAFSPDGRRILTGSADSTAKVWEAGSGRKLLTLEGRSSDVSSVCFSPDGQRIVTGSDHGPAKVWESVSGTELLTLNSLFISSNFVGGTFRERVVVWDGDRLTEVLLPKETSYGVNSVVFSPDGRRIVTGCADGTAKVWEAEWFQRDTIPLRDPQARSNLIDLSRYYNAGLSQGWRLGTGESDLSALPQGIQTLAGVEFDVRGLIQVGWWSRTGPYSNVDSGIAVEHTCRRVHFLHAAVNAVGVANGTQIGRYVIRRDNGQTNEIPIIIGQQIAHWRKQTNEARGDLVVAWMQSEESAAKEKKQQTRLFKMTWENPSPEVGIKNIDLISTHKNAALFLVAITTEP